MPDAVTRPYLHVNLSEKPSIQVDILFTGSECPSREQDAEEPYEFLSCPRGSITVRSPYRHVVLEPDRSAWDNLQLKEIAKLASARWLVLSLPVDQPRAAVELRQYVQEAFDLFGVGYIGRSLVCIVDKGRTTFKVPESCKPHCSCHGPARQPR